MLGTNIKCSREVSFTAVPRTLDPLGYSLSIHEEAIRHHRRLTAFPWDCLRTEVSSFREVLLVERRCEAGPISELHREDVSLTPQLLAEP